MSKTLPRCYSLSNHRYEYQLADCGTVYPECRSADETAWGTMYAGTFYPRCFDATLKSWKVSLPDAACGGCPALCTDCNISYSITISGFTGNPCSYLNSTYTVTRYFCNWTAEGWRGQEGNSTYEEATLSCYNNQWRCLVSVFQYVSGILISNAGCEGFIAAKSCPEGTYSVTGIHIVYPGSLIPCSPATGTGIVV